MTKKEYLEKLLIILSEDWDIARGLLMLIKDKKIEDVVLDELHQFFSDKLMQATESSEQKKLQKVTAYLRKLKETEDIEKFKESEENTLINLL